MLPHDDTIGALFHRIRSHHSGATVPSGVVTTFNVLSAFRTTIPWNFEVFARIVHNPSYNFKAGFEQSHTAMSLHQSNSPHESLPSVLNALDVRSYASASSSVRGGCVIEELTSD